MLLECLVLVVASTGVVVAELPAFTHEEWSAEVLEVGLVAELLLSRMLVQQAVVDEDADGHGSAQDQLHLQVCALASSQLAVGTVEAAILSRPCELRP